MAELERRYAGQAEFVLLYTREFNPGIGRFRDLTDPTTLEGRLALARRLKQDFDAAGRHCTWVVDSMANRLHEAYGSPKGASIVVERGGRVAFKGAWASPEAVDQALAPLVAQVKSAPHDVQAGFFVSLDPEPARPVVNDAAAGLWMEMPARDALAPRPPARPAAAEGAVVAAPPVVATPAPPPVKVSLTPLESRLPGDAATWGFEVGGMVCQGCAISIREAVGVVPHVANTSLSYRPGLPGALAVTGDGVDPLAVRRAIERTGFTVLSGPRPGVR